MKSITSLYKIGTGPSSSHTMGPVFAVEHVRSQFPEADSFSVCLYGSLARTGKGHQTDRAIIAALEPLPVKIIFDIATDDLPHPNTMDITAFCAKQKLACVRAISVGGGTVFYAAHAAAPTQNDKLIAGAAVQAAGVASTATGLSDAYTSFEDKREVYKENSFTEIARYCAKHNMCLSDYVFACEDEAFRKHLRRVWRAMKAAIRRGLAANGELPGGLHVQRKAACLFNQNNPDESASTHENRMVCAYAYAVAEENAGLGTVVTAPTCGACGVLPAVLKYMQTTQKFDDNQIMRALAVAGLIGNLIRTNASISGAECGCQAEIGSACSMAAAALAELYHMEINQIEYAAEVAMEHMLGLTCDPVAGLVQIPCIERNAVAAMRALNAVSLARFLTDTRKISFDLVIETMYQTGLDLHPSYRETSTGGLAKLYRL